MQITVATYEHRYGADVRAFVNEDDAWAWQREISAEWYDKEFGTDNKPTDADALNADYWDRIQNEWFTVQTCGLEISGTSSTAYLDRFPADARAFCDRAYQDGFTDGANNAND